MSEPLFAIGAAILVFHLVFWCLRARDLIEAVERVPTLDPQTTVHLPKKPPLISLIIPAHNEEDTIGECLQSALSQDYPGLEVILVDDRSGDGTVSVARSVGEGRENFQIVSVKERPTGWTGKCHALDVGVGHAAGEWLAFLDADSRLHPSALRQCLGKALESHVSMITLTPNLIMEGFWEKAIQPAMVSMSFIMFPLGKVNDPACKTASANGMFYLIRRDAYERIGGHSEVRSLAVEDIGIGKRVKAAGLGLIFANGGRIMQTRMYSGFRETLLGWTRILSASLNYDMASAFKYLGMHALMSLPVLALGLFLYVPHARLVLPNAWFILPFASLLGMFVVPPVYFGLMGAPRRYAALLIIGQLMLFWVFLIIVKRIWRKDALQWRGTTYQCTRYEPMPLDPLTPER